MEITDIQLYLSLQSIHLFEQNTDIYKKTLRKCVTVLDGPTINAKSSHIVYQSAVIAQ